MRRLGFKSQTQDREQGAVAIMVALLMVSLIGFTAFAIDVARVADQKAQLQNGADASALGVADYCSKNLSTCTSTGPSLANQYTTANSLDGSGVVGSLAIDTSASTVTVKTSTPVSGLPLIFARIFGQSSVQVNATATAAWGGGPLLGPATLPLVFPPCQVTPDTSITQYWYLKSDTNSNALNPSCPPDSTAHGPISGGFLFALTATTCSVNVIPGPPGAAYIQAGTGVDVPSVCKSPTDAFAANLGKVVLIPIYSGVAGNGAGGKYIVQQWAAVKLVGYRINPLQGGVSVPGNNNTRGIAIQFVSFVADPSKYSSGGLSDDGVTVPAHLTN